MFGGGARLVATRDFIATGAIATWWRGFSCAILLGALAAPACTDSKSADKKSAPPPAPVTVTTAARATVPVTLTAIGNVEPIQTVAIKSRIDGEVAAVHVKDGEDVARGELLFELDDRYLQAQLKQLEAAEARDRALLANAVSLDQRYKDLLAKGFVSEEAYTQARTGREAAEATAAAGRAAVETARVQLSYTRLRSPIAGRAGKVMLPLGSNVKANDTAPLVVINQIAPIDVSFSVPDHYLDEIRGVGATRPLPVRAAPQGAEGLEAAGRLSFIDNAVDAQTGTIRLGATFANDDRQLWPGQFVTVRVTLQEEADVVVIPSQAVQNGPKGQYVYVVKPDSTAELRDVVVERTEGEQAVVAKGLEAGETVVTTGQLRVVPGGKVAPRAGEA
jgi:multidrug efflux system membrane fusion protein